MHGNQAMNPKNAVAGKRAPIIMRGYGHYNERNADYTSGCIASGWPTIHSVACGRSPSQFFSGPPWHIIRVEVPLMGPLGTQELVFIFILVFMLFVPGMMRRRAAGRK